MHSNSMVYNVQTMARTHLHKLRKDARSSGVVATIIHAALDILVAVLLIVTFNKQEVAESKAHFLLDVTQAPILITLVWLLIAHVVVLLGLLIRPRVGCYIATVFYLVRSLLALFVTLWWPYQLVWIREQSWAFKQWMLNMARMASEVAESIRKPDIDVSTTTFATTTNATIMNGTIFADNATAASLEPTTEHNYDGYTIGLLVGVLVAFLVVLIVQTLTLWLFTFLSRALYTEYRQTLADQSGTSLPWNGGQETMASTEGGKEGSPSRHYRNA